MPKPEPLALKTTIPTTESAIKVRGDESGSARITFDIYPEELDQLKELFKFRPVSWCWSSKKPNQASSLTRSWSRCGSLSQQRA